MKKTKTAFILEILENSLMTAADIVTAVLESGYGASYSKLNQTYSKIESRRAISRFGVLERQKFYNLISKLKREELIEGDRKLKLTKIGKEKLMKLKNKPIDVKTLRYKSENDQTLKVVIFDIPENYRWKRNWLRISLVQLGFKILQKSVWVGKVKIPEEFIKDLRFMKIEKFIHIFSVNKLGSIDLEGE